MRKFIFITSEGITFQPASESSEPDIDNCQVLGFGKGLDPENAFENMLNENSYLMGTSFDEVICFELKNEERIYFSLQEARDLKALKK